MKRLKDIIVIGFALFAMFLGAGNIIFPPTLGALAGKQWVSTLIGFFLTGIGLPLLGVLSCSKAGGSALLMAKPLGQKISKVLIFIMVLCIGPLLAIPRTAAVTHELAIRQVFGNVSPLLTALVFFGLVLYFTLNASSVIDKVGTYLTPLLIIVLMIIVITSIVKPLGQPIDTEGTKDFILGFEGGYQTMDAIASLIFANIVIQDIRNKGYNKLEDINRLTMYASLIATVGLLIIYGGFTWIGASGSGIITTELSQVELLIYLIDTLMGYFGKIVLGIAVGLACLTTAIGLTSTVSKFLNELFPHLSYKFFVYFIIGFSGFLAIKGVDTIIAFSVPILSVLYPITIVLIMMNLFDNLIKYKSAYKGAALGAFIFSLLQNILSSEAEINNLLEKINLLPFLSYMTPLRVNFDTPLEIIQAMPLSKAGFVWLIPAIILGLVFYIRESIYATRIMNTKESNYLN